MHSPKFRKLAESKNLPKKFRIRTAERNEEREKDLDHRIPPNRENPGHQELLQAESAHETLALAPYATPLQ